MKRETAFFLAACSAIALASCAAKAPLSSSNVMMRAAKAGRELQSASYKAQAEFTVLTAAQSRVIGTASFDGRMQQAGEQMQFALAAEGRTQPQGAVEQQWKLDAEVIVAGEGEMYAHVSALTMNPPHPLLSSPLMAGLFGKWWKLPAAAPGSARASVTPDPRFLRMQTEIVDVVRDFGIENIEDAQAYHYGIAINRDKLAAFLREVARERGEDPEAASISTTIEDSEATGELWIDTDTFLIRRLVWNVLSKENPDDLRLHFVVDLKDFNSADPIRPPAESSELPGAPFLPGLPTGAPLPSGIPGMDGVPPMPTGS